MTLDGIALGPTYFDEACWHHNNGDHEKAERLYHQTLQEQPCHADAMHQLGALLVQRRGVEAVPEAMSLVLAAIQICPSCGKYRNSLGVLYSQTGRHTDAVDAFERANEKDPLNVRVLLNLAGALKHVGRRMRAAEVYRSVTLLEPSHPTAHYKRGSLLRELRRERDAIASLRQHLRLFPNDAQAQFWVAAMTGDATVAAAPPGMVAGLFDDYADTFEQHLTEKLHYKTPQLLMDVMLECAPPPRKAPQIGSFSVGVKTGWRHAVDLGCGTGLVGQLMRPHVRGTLDGVDLSAGMIAKARLKGCYDKLVVQELSSFLEAAADAVTPRMVATTARAVALAPNPTASRPRPRRASSAADAAALICRALAAASVVTPALPGARGSTASDSTRAAASGGACPAGSLSSTSSDELSEMPTPSRLVSRGAGRSTAEDSGSGANSAAGITDGSGPVPGSAGAVTGRARPYDLLVAADVLVYIGDLLPVLTAAARAASQGAIFAFSVEALEAIDPTAASSGRPGRRGSDSGGSSAPAGGGKSYRRRRGRSTDMQPAAQGASSSTHSHAGCDSRLHSARHARAGHDEDGASDERPGKWTGGVWQGMDCDAGAVDTAAAAPASAPTSPSAAAHRAGSGLRAGVDPAQAVGGEQAHAGRASGAQAGSAVPNIDTGSCGNVSQLVARFNRPWSPAAAAADPLAMAALARSGAATGCPQGGGGAPAAPAFLRAPAAARHYRLQTTGRYVHSAEHVRCAAAAAGWRVLRISEATLRMNAGTPVKGHLVVLQFAGVATLAAEAASRQLHAAQQQVGVQR